MNCETCGAEMEWVECPNCDEGEDSVAFIEHGKHIPCEVCKGFNILGVCPNGCKESEEE